jgi:hypothetical protein
MEKAQEHLKKEAENRREVDFCIEDIGLDIKKRGKLFVQTLCWHNGKCW